MSTIIEKNLMPIRPSMDVRVGLVDYVGQSITMTPSVGEAVAWPPPAGVAPMETGMPPAPTSQETSKNYGWSWLDGMFTQSQTFSVSISSDTTIGRLFVLAEYDGYWILRKGSTSTAMKTMQIVEINAATVTLTFTRYSGTAKIWIVPCSSRAAVLDNTNLTRVNLNLASNLDIFSPSLEVSTIEVSAYMPGLELAELVEMDFTIIYSAGYEGEDMSSPRFFYLSDPPEYDKNELTVKGEDATARLDDYQVAPVVMQYTDGLTALYNKLSNVITAAGIWHSAESAPASVSPLSNLNAIIKQQSGREFVANIMATCRAFLDDEQTSHAFLPVYVDSGKPSLRWQCHDADWPAEGPFDVYDIGDLKEEVKRKVKGISTYDDYGLTQTITEDADRETIASVSVKNNKTYTQNFDAYYRSVSVSRSTNPRKYTAQSATWKALSTGTSNVTGYRQQVQVLSAYAGTDVFEAFEPKIYGDFSQIVDASETMITVPDYNYMLSNQNERGGSFVWRGNPHMQPRDPFYLHIDNDVIVCTVERIDMTHEAGGTSATIHYKRGVC